MPSVSPVVVQVADTALSTTSVCPVAGIISVVRISLHTVQDLCFVPLCSQDSSMSVIQSLSVCPKAEIVPFSSIVLHTVHSLCLEPTCVQSASISTIQWTKVTGSRYFRHAWDNLW